MNDGEGPATGSHGTLKWAIRTAGIAGFVGLVAVQHFAHPDRDAAEPTRTARADTGRGHPDPETTGSIAAGARSVRLDPCSLQSGRPGPHP